MESLFIITYIFITALLLGSFFNVVGLRVPNNQSIVAPRSACPNCKHQLTAVELIPVFSFLLQKGSCKSCKASISPIYPVVELITAILFTISPMLVGWSKELVISWTLISLFMIIFVSDVHYMIIPDKVLLFFFGLFFIERILIPLTPWWDSLLGAIVGFTLLLVIAIVSKGGMGGGDIKLFGLIGFVVGWKLVLLSFFLSTLAGALFGIVGILIGKVKKGKPFPFGPYIILGTLLAYFFGDQLIRLYLTMFI
ncbi:prepilin peptidase [Cytobacillus sp. S13-E01]|uniref:prepilin peptidase n=1 Tax=Cytobacillus sp. S13-E01 TaxID=3031326 RepID=UPI0023D7D320|nr:A24 family peptidase [Cytobacillus sp. S13-E01]MDF0726761.1 prepilin peptidase [Cytobacillus sp. S13-E01]